MGHKLFPALAFLIVTILPSPVWAGALYGTILNEQGRPLKNATIAVTMDGSNKTYEAAGKTDGSGSYRVAIPETGRGILSVSDASGTVKIKIYVFKNSVRWNLKRIRTNAGVSLRKR